MSFAQLDLLFYNLVFVKISWLVLDPHKVWFPRVLGEALEVCSVGRLMRMPEF